MAPVKPVKPVATALNTNAINFPRRAVPTRSQQNVSMISKALKDAKRKADESPIKETKTKTMKRPAFGDITNALVTKQDQNKKLTLNNVNGVKKVTIKSKELPSVKNVEQKIKGNLVPNAKVLTRAALRGPPIKPSTKSKPNEVQEKIALKKNDKLVQKTDKECTDSADKEIFEIKKCITTRRSNSSEKSEDSLGESTLLPSKVLADKNKDLLISPSSRVVPEGINDFDKENWDDIYQASHYAMDIFEYLKNRESQFQIKDYMPKQVSVTTWMRSLLVDWMVEVQESFELNHETLYLAVKLVDIYLSQVIITKELLQLVGASALFISSKFDERIPPLVDDFLYICDGAYKRRELIQMEINMLKVCKFQLGIPLSYRFLRRYARCAKVAMPTLTLARYILEYSLLNYSTVTKSDSKLAAASLYLALRMKNLEEWTSTLEYYSGYTLDDIMPEIKLLNEYLHKSPKESLKTIRNKYSHKIFFEVALTPLVTI